MLLQPQLHSFLLRQLRINLLPLPWRRGPTRITSTHLPLHQLCKRTILIRRQVPVRARLRDLPVGPDADDEIAALNGAEAMRDGDGGVGTFQHAVQGLVDQGFGFGVECARGFVQNQDVRVLQ